MKTFLKQKLPKKLKIMLVVFSIINIILVGMIISDFLTYDIPFYYIFFIFLGFAISLFFKKDKTITWDKKTEKVIKTMEISTFLIIGIIIFLRKFLLPNIFESLHLTHITTITLIITLGFFSGKLYFMYDKLKDIFCEFCKN